MFSPPSVCLSLSPSIHPAACQSTCQSIRAWFPLSNLNGFWYIDFRFCLHMYVYQECVVWDCYWTKFVNFYTAPNDSGGVLWFQVDHLCVHPSVCHPSVHLYFCFWTITWVNFIGFSPNLVCALILWSSGLGLLMASFPQFLTELSVHDMS